MSRTRYVGGLSRLILLQVFHVFPLRIKSKAEGRAKQITEYERRVQRRHWKSYDEENEFWTTLEHLLSSNEQNQY